MSVYLLDKDTDEKILVLVPPKTGSSSLRQLFKKFEKLTLPISDYKYYWQHHIRVQDIINIKSVNTKTFRIITIRNPFERLYSLYKFFKTKTRLQVLMDLSHYILPSEKIFSNKIHQEAREQSFNNFVKRNIVEIVNWKVFNYSQIDMITNNNQIVVDCIIRMEYFSEHCQKILSILKQKHSHLNFPNLVPHSNRTNKDPISYLNAYDDETTALVRKYSYKDLTVFEYDLQPCTKKYDPINDIALYQTNLNKIVN